MAGYLFAHFTGEHKDGEQVYFSLSNDGLNWKDLNHGKPVLITGIGEKGARDPFLIKDEKNGKYYIIATDLRIEAGKGWGVAQYEGSRDLLVWESNDLVNWSDVWAVTVGIEGAGCVWAPEAVYDYEKEAFFVFWASMVKEDGDTEAKQRIYCAYTNDFKTFTETEKYIERENHIIDTTIVYDNGKYYRFSKDETTKTVNLDACESLRGQFKQIKSDTIDNMYGVEGPECYLLPDGRTWCLIVDRFATGKGYLPIVTDDLESGDLRVLDDMAYDMGVNKKRHGGVLKLNDEEYNRLKEAYGDSNPVIDGLYADPDIAIFDDTYYIYPTTDGFTGWSGTQFYVFASKDGRKFENKGLIVDLATEQVPWSIGSAWAPCIATKNGKYYFYFCGKEKDGRSAIGVAVSDSPVGPFDVKATPIVTMDMMAEYGIKMGQTIDPSIYNEGDEVYLLFGNSHAAIAKLSDDMMDIDVSTLKNIDGLFDFREAVTVFKKDDIYHFTWSCDDTRSENYHVNYGVSDKLYGPVQYKYTILEKDESRKILGTGHHSITKNEKTGEYVIAYHRFGTPVNKYIEGKGFNRETCLAKITFDKDGYVEKVVMED